MGKNYKRIRLLEEESVYLFFFLIKQESIEFAQMSGSDHPETRRLRESPLCPWAKV